MSPLGLPDFRKLKNKKHRYERTVGKATNRAFPDWARSAEDPEVARMKKLGQLGANYAELTVTGVESVYFLFYVGVK